MSRTRRPSERHTILASVVEIAARLDADTPTVIARLREWSVGISGGSGPTAKGTVSDPTGMAALSTDDHSRARQRYDDLLSDLWVKARELDGIRREVMTPPLTHAEAEKRQENQKVGALQPCANIHGCPSDAWAEKAGRCSSCYKYRHRHGHDRRMSGGGGE